MVAIARIQPTVGSLERYGTATRIAPKIWHSACICIGDTHSFTQQLAGKRIQ